MLPFAIPHKDLVSIAERWLARRGSCGVTFTELKCLHPEIADVIGFGCGDHSVLIECKASRSDFLADAKKPFRINPQFGMGKFRLYCTPLGLITRTDLPAKWGLIQIDPTGKVHVILNPMTQGTWKFVDENWTFHERNTEGERDLLYSACRRLTIRGLISEIYTPQP